MEWAEWGVGRERRCWFLECVTSKSTPLLVAPPGLLVESWLRHQERGEHPTFCGSTLRQGGAVRLLREMEAVLACVRDTDRQKQTETEGQTDKHTEGHETLG